MIIGNYLGCVWSSPTEGAQFYLMDLVSSNGIHLDTFNSILPIGVTAIICVTEEKSTINLS